MGRSLDIEKAVKQLARDPRHASLSIIAVFNPVTQRAELYEQPALAFGARNCV